MKMLFSVSLLLLVLLPVVAPAQTAPHVHKEIAAVLEQIRLYNQAAWRKDSVRGNVLGTQNEKSFQERGAFYARMIQRLQRISSPSLSFDDEINLALLQHQVLDELATVRFRAYLNPILSDWGFHTSLAGRANTSIRTKADAERYIAILKDIPRYVRQNLALMRTGLAAGISQPRVILEGYASTYVQHIVDSVEASVFWRPFTTKPIGISAADWERLRQNARSLVMDSAVSSYRVIRDFFVNEYAPKTRTSLGASALPDGKAFYEDRVRHYTTTAYSSEDVYQIGLQEVARIKAQMDSVIKTVGFSGNFQEFIQFLRTNERFYPKTADELLKEAAFIAKTVDGKLPSMFGKLPRQPYTVAPVPAYLAPSFTAGRYSSAPVDGTRAGEYWVNTYNLASRSLYTLEALTLHEAVPGHHLQIALTQELANLPSFRRNFYINAFGEGWGLYSEYLGHEMGFYQDPYSLFGRLTYEMWRACRLVIDVGIHTKGWTKEEAVRYLADHTALSLHEVNTEINRYISWPGQALAYKIGELKIIEQRRKAESALKEKFDVRAFHDMVLSKGTVTLALLEKMTDRFIAEQR